MIQILPASDYGITCGIDKLIKLIQDNPDELVKVARVHDGDNNYSFIALFLEKGTIGQYVAFLQEWETNDGMSGEGGRGFIRMNQFLEDNNIAPEEILLDKSENKKLGHGGKYIENIAERYAAWQHYVLGMLQYD